MSSKPDFCYPEFISGSPQHSQRLDCRVKTALDYSPESEIRFVSPRNDVKKTKSKSFGSSFRNNFPNYYYTRFTAILGAWFACANREADAC
jgi:hypothetical protein